jgi:hypothetical protein
MTGIFEAARRVFKRNNSIVYDAENVSKAFVSAHHYLHHVLLAGNYCDAGKPIAYSVVQKKMNDEYSTRRGASD